MEIHEKKHKKKTKFGPFSAFPRENAVEVCPLFSDTTQISFGPFCVIQPNFRPVGNTNEGGGVGGHDNILCRA